MNTLTISYSPCPNDTFIFDALVNHKIDTGGLNFEVALEDVQTLNEWTRAGKTDISKISYAVLPAVLDRYSVLNSGGALGVGVGPLLIASTPVSDDEQQVNNKQIAIPGENTTANFLFSLAYPRAGKKVFMRFDEIESFVAEGKGLGVIIHENRFTYQQKGLSLVQDLGNIWEQVTGNPIPLGGIVVRRELGQELQFKIDQLIHKSLEYAFKRYPVLSEYVAEHAREMDRSVMRQHIDLYVNDFSRDLGIKGREAVMFMLETIAPGHWQQADVFVTNKLGAAESFKNTRM